jgi:hypothetical protein
VNSKKRRIEKLDRYDEKNFYSGALLDKLDEIIDAVNELLKSRTDKHEREEGMKISWKPVDDDSIYLPFLGVVECGVEPHERGRLLDITNLYEALKRIESNEANVLVNVTSLKEHLLEQIKNNR